MIEDLFCITLNNISKEDAKFYAETYGLVYKPSTHKGFDLAGPEDNVREMLEDYIGRYDEIGKIMNEGWYVPEWNRGGFVNPNKKYADSKKIKDIDEPIYYGLFQKGGSIGQNANAGYRKYPDGILLEVYLDREEAKADAKRYRKNLTPGERSYYGMGYTVKPLNKSDLKNSYVQEMINKLGKNIIKDKKVKDDEEVYSIKNVKAEIWKDFLAKFGETTEDNPNIDPEDYCNYYGELYKGNTKVAELVYMLFEGGKGYFAELAVKPLDNNFEAILRKIKGYGDVDDNEIPKGFSHEIDGVVLNPIQTKDFTKPFKPLLKVLNTSKKKAIKDSVESEVSEGAKEALDEYLEWEGIIGYDEDIIEVYESGTAWVDDEFTDYEDSYDALDAYLTWEGILGYTDAIYDILKHGVDSIYYDSMLTDKFSYEEE